MLGGQQEASYLKLLAMLTHLLFLHVCPKHARPDTTRDNSLCFEMVSCCAMLCCAGGYVDFVSLRDMTRYLASNNHSIQSNRKQLRTLGIYAARAAIALPWSGR